MEASIDIPAIVVKQPIGLFFVGMVEACRLRQLAWTDTRRISGVDELELYTGIQRIRSKERVADIKQYISTVDATFPNSIIVNILPESDTLKITTSDGNESDIDALSAGDRVNLHVADKKDVFKIIDGQHRLAGFDNENCKEFHLIVTIFVGLPVEDQAYLFSTINLTQQKVPKSLVYDLFDIAESRSPQRTAHTVVKTLNNDPASPFYKRIRLLGVIPRFDEAILYRGVLTQGTVVDRLLRQISRDPMLDRDREKRNQPIELAGNEMERGLIFREFYARGEDWAILKTMENFFGAVAENFPDEWGDLENPLARTIGYGALMRLLVPLYRQGFGIGDISRGFFGVALERARRAYEASGIEITFEEFPAAGNGETKLYRQFAEWCEVET